MIGVDVDEAWHHGETPSQYVLRLAREKAERGRRSDAVVRDPLPVIGADTAVVVDGKVLGKPSDREEFGEMMSRLSGRTHRVLTGVALSSSGTSTRLSESLVTFRKLDDEDVLRYWLTGEPADKAGGYGIQGVGAVFVERLEGSYSGVVGLPLFETAELLRETGMTIPAEPLESKRP